MTATTRARAASAPDVPVPRPRPAAPEAATGHVTAQAWRALRYFAAYRVLIAAFLLAIGLAGLTPGHELRWLPRLYLGTAAAYFPATVAAAWLAAHRRPRLELQLSLAVLVDVAALTLLAFATGGVRGGLALLVIISVGAGSVLAGRRQSLGFAALASLSVLAGEIYAQAAGWGTGPTAYSQAGLLGATCFAGALLVNWLAERLRATEALAERRGVDLANLAQLNETIVQRLEAGVVVVDAEGRVRLANSAAWRILGMPAGGMEGRPLREVSPELGGRYAAWRHDPTVAPEPLRTGDGGEYDVRCVPLGAGERAGTALFLEDTAAIVQRAHQMKLAALGRLTASIAHEIRNPLGAISHAAQLLAESEALTGPDRRLAEIVVAQAGRMNTIVENVLQLSRGGPGQPEPVELRPWLEDFAAEFARAAHLAEGELTVAAEDGLVVRADPSHLHQVLWNLCQNAADHGRGSDGRLRLALRAGRPGGAEGGAVIEVCDEGPGIPPEEAERVFEPFYTTRAEGSGLGLYLARELCEVNGAHLTLVPNPRGGCCFRITFPPVRLEG